MTFRRKQPGPFQRNMRLDRVALALAQAYLLGTGFASDLPFGVTAFLKTRPEEVAPDMQMLFWMGATNAASPYLPPFKQAFADSFSCRAMPMRPVSRDQSSSHRPIRRSICASTRTSSAPMTNGASCATAYG